MHNQKRYKQCATNCSRLAPAPSLPRLVLPGEPSKDKPLLKVALVAKTRVGAYDLASFNLWSLSTYLACFCQRTVSCHAQAYSRLNLCICRLNICTHIQVKCSIMYGRCSKCKFCNLPMFREIICEDKMLLLLLLSHTTSTRHDVQKAVFCA